MSAGIRTTEAIAEGAPARSVQRVTRAGSVALVLLLAAVLCGGAIGLSMLANEHAERVMMGSLVLLAVIGVVALFAGAIGIVEFTGRAARHDVTKSAVDSATEGFLAVDGDGRPLYANGAYLRLAGASGLDDLRTVERLLTGSPDVSEAVYRLAKAAREGQAAGEEMRLTPQLGASQGAAWYRVRTRPLDVAGKRCALWSVTDITRERERQENVFQELQHAIDYLDHAPAGFMSIDGTGEIVYMNATLANWLDYDLAQFGSGGLLAADIVAGYAAALLTAGEGAPGEVRTETVDLDLRRRNGTSLPVRLLHRVAFGHDGLAGASRTLVMNRSAGVDVEEGQRAAEVRFARFFNNTPLAIATVAHDGRILRSNAPFLRLFGPIFRGQDALDARPIAAVVSEREREALTAAIASAGAGRGDIAPLDLPLTGEGTRSARFFVSAVEEGAEDGEAAIVYALDTTEQRALEAQFAQAQKMQAVGELAGGVAHDFNNVLQGILGYADLLLVNHRPTDPSFQDIMQIKQNANRAAGLVRQLLAFSRRQTLRPQVIQFGEVLSELTMLLRRLLGEKIELDTRHGRDLWQVKADLTQFEQVVVNLAVNARDAMADGGKLSIRTRNVAAGEASSIDTSFAPGDYVLLEVSDSGTGIPEEIREKIFQPFFTTKEVGKGTGLGLSMVYGFVKQSGGYILCESKVGEGTTFRIFLPRHIPGERDDETLTVSARPTGQIAGPDKGSAAAVSSTPAPVTTVQTPPARPKADVDLTGHGTILLVEDEEAVRAFGARALTQRGYTVLEAGSGIEALRVIEEHGGTIDLIVSDVVMPEMDGPSLLGELRRRGSDARIIFVSGYAEEAFSKNLPEGESFGFLPKPFSLKQLIEAVKAAMG